MDVFHTTLCLCWFRFLCDLKWWTSTGLLTFYSYVLLAYLTIFLSSSKPRHLLPMWLTPEGI